MDLHESPDTSPKPIHVLAIDIGSSSTRTAVFDSGLNLMAGTMSQREYSLDTAPGGRAVFDAGELIDTLFDCIDETLGDVEHVDIVGVSCFWHSLLGLDGNGRPTTPVFTWADTRASALDPDDGADLDQTRFHQRTGTRFHASYPAAKLRWLRSDDPERYRSTSRWVSFAEYLHYQVSGKFRVSPSMASGTGLLNRTTLTWDELACEAAGVDVGQLSVINSRSDNLLATMLARRWPSLTNAAWFPAIGDGAANNLGAGATSASNPALMIGTTGAIRVMTTESPGLLADGIWQYRLDEQRLLLGGALSEGGGTLAWLYSTLSLPREDVVNATIANSEPDGHGLTVLPYLNGQRSPRWDAAATFSLHGVTASTSPTDIVQATMESIACSFMSIMNRLAPYLREPVEIIATGNGLRKNDVWAQIIADALGVPLLLPTRTEASLRGAARYALEQSGSRLPDNRLSEGLRRFEPVPEHRQIFVRASERRNQLESRLD